MGISFAYPLALWALLLLPLALIPVLARVVSAGDRRHALRSLPRRLWAAASVRSALLLLLILALAGTQIVRASASLTTVYLLDGSDSIAPSERQRAEAFVRESLAAMPAGDRAAIVVFGGDALVERLPGEDRELPRIASVPVATRSDLEGALQLALTLLPEGGRKRAVLLSDGLENEGHAAELAAVASARDIDISYVRLEKLLDGAEAYVDTLNAPASVRQGQRFELEAVIESSAAQRATVMLLDGGRLVRSLDVDLVRGTNRVRFPIVADEAGFRRYRVELSPTTDNLTQNNWGAAFTVVQGPPRILLLAERPGEAEPLRAALVASGMEADVVSPAAAPRDLPALSGYDAVFVVNVPAAQLPVATMQALPQYVRQLGRGLVMVGGPDSYGAGGYLRTPLEDALPVYMDVRDQEQEPNLALVLAVDKSGSMGRCHCENPNSAPGSYDRMESGLPKVEIAKAAILQTASVLGRLDFLGVVGFDQNAHWSVRLQQLINGDQLQQAIGGMEAFGQTNVYAGLNEAYLALTDADARLKHIILLTDGWSNSGDYATLIERMKEQGITLSVIAAGGGSATYLRDLATAGGGRYYPAADIQSLPQLFLKETVQVAGRYIIEQPFFPLQAQTTPVLEGIAALPGLYGYNGSTPKGGARVPLISPDGDPVLAQWQYGLGRTAAWTSDLTGRWAREWVDWDRFSQFAGQLAGWVLPDAASDRLQAGVRLDGDRLRVEVDAVDEGGQPWNLLDVRATVIGPDLAPHELPLSQTAPGRYEGQMPAAGQGAFLAQVAAQPRGAAAGSSGAATASSGAVLAYSPEYRERDAGAGALLLRDLASATGGQALAAPDQAWARTGAPASAATPVSPTLLLLAALLLPFDVAVRRLVAGRRELAELRLRLRQWFVRRRAPEPVPGSEPELLGDLFEARSRGRLRSRRDHPTGDAPKDEPR